MQLLIVCLSLVGAACAKPSSADLDRILETHSVEERALPDEWQVSKMAEFFKVFAKEEMMEALDSMEPSLSRISLPLSVPCLFCMRDYLRCKSVCYQLVPESNVFFFDQFACFSVCWQKVVSCCVASSRSTMKNSMRRGSNINITITDPDLNQS